MVQVDALWSLGIGAGCAVAHHQQLRAAAAQRRSAFQTDAYRSLLLLLGAVFAPSGMFLLWSFPSWETMHVLDRSMPGWAVATFAATNVTQGVLGFALSSALLARNRPLGAALVWAFGYVGMFFVLMHGWDGTGYQRFFSNTPEELASWQWGHAARWFTGDVAVSLYVMGVVLVPALIWPCARALSQARGVKPVTTTVALLVAQVVLFPVVALVLTVLMIQLGALVGGALGLGMVALLLLPRAPLRTALVWFAQAPQAPVTSSNSGTLWHGQGSTASAVV